MTADAVHSRKLFPYATEAATVDGGLLVLNLFRLKQSGHFFTWFEEAAQNNVEAAKLLQELCRDFREADKVVEQLHGLEHRGDEIGHKVYDQLNQVFMPPIDREDILTLTRRLDDVMDYIHAAADSMCIYNIRQPTPVALDLSSVILSCTEQVARALPALRQRRTMPRLENSIIELNRLENQADEMLRRGLMDLFHSPHDPLDALAWSKIYEMMEKVTDECEDIADVFRGLVIKHA
jgi:predicted phosphate transport protein (TIGR00153 family)